MKKTLKMIAGVLCIAFLFLQEHYHKSADFPMLFSIIHMIISMVAYAMLEYIIDLKIFNKK